MSDIKPFYGSNISTIKLDKYDNRYRRKFLTIIFKDGSKTKISFSELHELMKDVEFKGEKKINYYHLNVSRFLGDSRVHQ